MHLDISPGCVLCCACIKLVRVPYIDDTMLVLAILKYVQQVYSHPASRMSEVGTQTQFSSNIEFSSSRLHVKSIKIPS